MFISRMTRVMVCVLCVWLLTELVAESTKLNHSPRAALAQFPGMDIVSGTALNDTDSSAAGSVPEGQFHWKSQNGFGSADVHACFPRPRWPAPAWITQQSSYSAGG
jgi:hypothetical protein